MKRLFVNMGIALACVAFATSSYAQVSAPATVTATIVAPISIINTANMNFGNVATNATAIGTVVLTPAGVRSATGGVTLPADPSATVSAASFTVGGTAGYSYVITLPTAAIEISNGVNTMTVDNFTSDPSGTGSLAGGTSILNVGATLNVAAGQAAGAYTSTTPFTVTVNYN